MARPLKFLLLLLGMLWASPWTLFGLFNGLVTLLSGGHAQRSGRVLEFWDGWATVFLATFPWIKGASAVTFGHVVLARDRRALDSSRRHERVHVRQYEIWGPLFIPAYLACWFWLPLRGKNSYLDNPFEQAAFAVATEDDRPLESSD
jgi:hypothetical protein